MAAERGVRRPGSVADFLRPLCAAETLDAIRRVIGQTMTDIRQASAKKVWLKSNFCDGLINDFRCQNGVQRKTASLKSGTRIRWSASNWLGGLVGAVGCCRSTDEEAAILCAEAGLL